MFKLNQMAYLIIYLRNSVFAYIDFGGWINKAIFATKSDQNNQLDGIYNIHDDVPSNDLMSYCPASDKRNGNKTDHLTFRIMSTLRITIISQASIISSRNNFHFKKQCVSASIKCCANIIVIFQNWCWFGF